MALTGSNNAEKIWNYFQKMGMPAYGIAGLMGNLDCESCLNPKNLEDQYERKSGYTDETYTNAVDSGAYANFARDSFGFGLAQWTWHTRKQSLLNYAKSHGKSVGDLEMQLDFLVNEMKTIFPSVWNTLMNATSLLTASNAVLINFENPLDKSTSVQARRANCGQVYYNRFANKQTATVEANKEVKPTMGYYTFTKGTKQNLSSNFMSNEFDCHGSGCCNQTRINEKLVTYLQKIRDHFGTSITITSAYRCPTHNSRVGGATGSRHSVGDAADIVVAGHTPSEVAKYAESIGILGIGLYETSSDGHFVHIDTREAKSFWYGQAQAYRSTFGGTLNAGQTSVQNIVQSVAKPAANPNLIKYGDSNDYVKKLQEQLIALGYDCGSCGADGSFGLATKKAVEAFQKKSGLVVDGIAGAITLTALDKATSDGSTEFDHSGAYYEVTANLLNVRDGAGINNKIVATVAKGSMLGITEIKNGWGKFSVGWVCMDYCKRKG